MDNSKHSLAYSRASGPRGSTGVDADGRHTTLSVPSSRLPGGKQGELLARLQNFGQITSIAEAVRSQEPTSRLSSAPYPRSSPYTSEPRMRPVLPRETWSPSVPADAEDSPWVSNQSPFSAEEEEAILRSEREALVSILCLCYFL
jgi:hypothetical protein